MRKDITFIDILLRSRPYLIVGLSLASGYTTFIGLHLYIRWWLIALVLTAAVQSLIVIGTLQLTMAHWSASARRVLSVISCLLLAMGVSVFFSYFAFYQQFEADHLSQEKFAQVTVSVDGFADRVLAAKSRLVAAQSKTVNDLREQSRLEALGKNGKPGKGPNYRVLKEEADTQARVLDQMQRRDDAEQRATDLKAFLLRAKPADLASDEVYIHLQDMLGACPRIALSERHR